MLNCVKLIWRANFDLITRLLTSRSRLQASRRVGSAPSPISSVSHSSVTSKLALLWASPSVQKNFKKKPDSMLLTN